MAISQGAWAAGPPPGMREMSFNACVRVVPERVRRTHGELAVRDISNVPIPSVCELIFPISEIKVKKQIGGSPVRDVVGWLKCRVLKIMGDDRRQGIMVYSLVEALGIRVRREHLEQARSAVECAIRELETPPPQVAFSIHVGGTAPLDRHSVRSIVEDLVAGAVVTEVRMLRGRAESCLRSPNDTDASAMYGVSAIVDVVSSAIHDQVLDIPQRVDFLLPSGHVVPLSIAMSVLPHRARPRTSVPRSSPSSCFPPPCADAGVPPSESFCATPPSASMPPFPPPPHVPECSATPVLPRVLDPALLGNPFALLPVDDLREEECMRVQITSYELDPSPRTEPCIPLSFAKKHESGNQARQSCALPQMEASCAGSVSEKGQEEREKMLDIVAPLNSPPLRSTPALVLSPPLVSRLRKLPRVASVIPRPPRVIPRPSEGHRVAPKRGQRGGRL